MKLELRAAAVRDLDGVFDYSLEAFGAERAEAYVRGLYAAMERLREFPSLGHATDLRPGVRVLAAQEHRIFYRAEGEAIVVARVLHKAMDAGRHL